ncbi:hypothetical protein [Paraclostridium bifermentans]|uniref:hypothetical protein n=1 Tax=Paraclostridium bifermentans TaxID=1490 RepID=UPI00359C8768
MNDLLIMLNSDIKRCNEVLSINDYLEIVITLEELNDKYKDNIEASCKESNRVWNYTKKDLQILKDKLIQKRDEIVNEYIYINIDIKSIIENMKSDISINKELEYSEKEEAINILESIYIIYKEKISRELKWEKLKKYIAIASSKDVYLGSKILELINLIIKK